MKKKNKIAADPSRTFDIHTMESDNAARDAQPANMPAEQPLHNPLAALPQQQHSSDPNPFLNDDAGSSADDSIGKSAFAAPAALGPEKINYDIADITAAVTPTSEENSEQSSATISKKRIFIIVGVVIVVVAGIAGALYYYMSTRTVAEPDVPQTPAVDQSESPADTPDPTPTTYSVDMPNYFPLDVNSPTVVDDIAAQLRAIRANVAQQAPQKPVIFIVTDAASSAPLSFHQFVLAARMGLTEDILSTLDKDFEIYAYDDPTLGVRFGIVVNTKDPIALQSALRTHEPMLPQAFATMMSSDAIGGDPVGFADNTYHGKTLRYANLNAAETYSIDYAVHNNQWLLGTSKNTLLAIFDDLHERTSYQEPPSGFSY